jgi:small GTP-binding protein
MQGLLGVDSLDALLGDVPPGAKLLLSCQPDVDGRSVLAQASRAALRSGSEVVYLVTERPPSAIRRALTTLGQSNLENLHFIDAYSGTLASPSDYSIRNPKDIDEIIGALSHSSADHKGALLCIESVSSLLDRSGSELGGSATAFYTQLAQFGATLGLYVEWATMPVNSGVIRNFDGLMTLYGIEEKIVRNLAFKLKRLNWHKNLDTAPRLVVVRPDGGLRAYIPKIAVTGPAGAGKTTFVNTLCDTAAGTERGQKTVSLDRGHYEGEDVQAELFGTPGESRFDPLIDSIIDQATAVIVMVDATNKEQFPRAKELLSRVEKRGLLAIIIANKQDLPGAVSPEELAQVLNHHTISSIATDSESAAHVMRTALEAILVGRSE